MNPPSRVPYTHYQVYGRSYTPLRSPSRFEPLTSRVDKIQAPVLALSAKSDDNSWLKYIIAGSVFATAFGNMFVMRSRLRSMSRWSAPTKKKTADWTHPSPSNMYEHAHVTKENLRGPNTPDGTHAAHEPWPMAGSGRFNRGQLSPQKRQQMFLDTYKAWKASGYNDDASKRPYFVPGSSIAESASFSSYLRTLKMREDSVPSPKEVKEAYRLIALELHPDSAANNKNINGKSSSSSSAGAEEDKKAQRDRAAFTEASNAAKALQLKLSDIEKKCV